MELKNKIGILNNIVTIGSKVKNTEDQPQNPITGNTTVEQAAELLQKGIMTLTKKTCKRLNSHNRRNKPTKEYIGPNTCIDGKDTHNMKNSTMREDGMDFNIIVCTKCGYWN